MKKLFALLLSAILVLGCFAGCASDDENATAPSTTKPAASQPATSQPATSQPATSQPSGSNIQVISIAKALELCGESGNITTEQYYIRGTVESIKNPAYGQMVITDGTHSIPVYGVEGYSSMADKPYKGDTVLLLCVLQNYNGTKEVKSAQLIEFEHVKVEVDESKYTDMSIADARETPEGALVKVDGVIAQITYANGKIPSGVVLVDDTASIYIYDGNIAARAKIGNTATILATKTWWVLEDEKNNAQKFGYKGCCQLDSATLVSLTDDVKDFNKAWITESTVKEIMDTPMSKDITSKIFKVIALVSKAEGKGFTNYYFNDLDGTTGSYTYTQCNGSDFAWLDKFDGKICTVYLMPLNAKSSNSGCVYRFLPIAVSDDGYKFDTAKAAEFAVKYHGIDQFQPSYSGNPELEVTTSVSSALLGFENAKLTYSSSDNAVLTFKQEGGKTVMHCLSTGKATVTIKGSYGGKTFSMTKEISVTITKEEVKYPTVADTIAAKVGDSVTVKGIVGPSLVNKVGFYLIDNTGIIAVQTDAATMGTLQIGHEVILSGVRHQNTKGSVIGQTCIKDATVVTNNYGSHAYDTSFFVTDKTLADFYALDINTNYTTTVFVLKATVEVVENKYYTSIALTSGSTKVSLYCSSANQYNWLKAYAGQEVTVEIAPCNWNDKTFYAGCVLAVRNSDGSKVMNDLNFTK